MGRRQRPHFKGRGLAAGLLLVLCVAGCNGNYAVQVSSPGAPPPPSTGATVNVYGSSLIGALFALGILSAASGVIYDGAPEMHPERRVVEQDCSQPIQVPSANLRCR